MNNLEDNMPLIFRGFLNADEEGKIMTPAAERGDVYVIYFEDGNEFPFNVNGVEIGMNESILTIVCTEKVEAGSVDIFEKWKILDRNEKPQFEEIPESVKTDIVTAATEEGKIEVKSEISDLAEEGPFEILKEPVIVPEETEKMFEEIERIDDLMHATVKIQNPHLRKLLEDGGHICMCGSLIFTSFLPDDIRAAYCKWHNYKMMRNLVEIGVNNIAETVDHAIVERIKDKYTQRYK